MGSKATKKTRKQSVILVPQKIASPDLSKPWDGKTPFEGDPFQTVLPVDMWALILSFISVKDLLNFSRASKGILKLTLNDAVWRSKITDVKLWNLDWKDHSLRELAQHQHLDQVELASSIAGNFVWIIGGQGSGKSSIFKWLREDANSTEEYSMTYLVPISDDIVVDLQVIDPIQSDQDSRGSGWTGFATIIVFDLSDGSSLAQARAWFSKRFLGSVLYLVGTKSDLERQVDRKDAMEVAREFRARYYECSSITGKNIRDIFVDIAQLFEETGSRYYIPRRYS
eukprot:TRINITY_DN5906_c0_g1_i2.p1 TRINITY_DN5906_c0_g1~~TRINITY_DN5906_c0_g1_i2.p1  ORF type:complete len:283 (+),score=31.85 TRINITY_DN5906_c0_g1_i2:20-868(+)